MFTTIILAAGAGSRMGGGVPKIMRLLGGQPMLAHLLRASHEAGASDSVLVLAPDMPEIAELARHIQPQIKIAIQKKQQGTADALAAGLAELSSKQTQIPAVVLYGDTPLILPSTIKNLARKTAKTRSLMFAGFASAQPQGYGRFIMAAKKIKAIEEDEGKQIFLPESLCNAGFMSLMPYRHAAWVKEIPRSKKTNEIYLTYLARLAHEKKEPANIVSCSEEEAAGANDLAGLAKLEALLQTRLRTNALRAGVQMTAPETCFFSADTKFAKGVMVEPYVIIGAGVQMASGVHIRAFSHIEGAVIGKNAVIGPYARIRPHTEIGADARIGNFVEVKQTKIGAGTKASHLSYLGDAEIGKESNIGAGTITCNYDGDKKHKTEIGAGAFIGSNAVLVAPVKIGKQAYIAAGSAITKNVPAKNLAFGRAQQVQKPKQEKKG